MYFDAGDKTCGIKTKIPQKLTNNAYNLVHLNNCTKAF